jgi:hypothetical protein
MDVAISATVSNIAVGCDQEVSCRKSSRFGSRDGGKPPYIVHSSTNDTLPSGAELLCLLITRLDRIVRTSCSSKLTWG